MKQGREESGGRESRWLCALVRLYPRAFRERFGDDVLRTLRAAHRAASASGVRGRVAFWARNVPDLIVGAARERIGGSGGRHEKEAGMRSSKTGVVSWLDFKLGFRMLVKYPGLTVVGGLAMAFAIAVGAGVFEFVSQVVSPNLPLEDGDRIVAMRAWDREESVPVPPSLYDFATWSEELRSVSELAAFRTVERNLIVGSGPSQPVGVAEITASGFGIARVPPLLGRSILPADEEAGADVIVIGYDVWQIRFDGDPNVVGRTLRLGSTQVTVVGVMPEGFSYPIAHRFWMPLRLRATDHEPGQGPRVRVLGRLAPGATIDEAQTEISTLARRMTLEFPEAYRRLRLQVMPYSQSILDIGGLGSAGLMSLNLFFVMLLVLVCGNVALLMFARAATREREVVVRSALGATRRRIIGQLFVEALVLGSLAAVIGLAAATFGLSWWLRVSEADAGSQLPFWFRGNLGTTAVLYAVILTLLGAFIAGVLPAWKVTGKGIGTGLREAGSGAGSLRLGGIWTVVVVAQVAITVAFPATAFFVRRSVVQVQTLDVGFPAKEYLSARLDMGQELGPTDDASAADSELRDRFLTAVQELEVRLNAESDVAAVAFAGVLPRTYHPQRWIEVDEGGSAEPRSGFGHRVGVTSVSPNFFDVLETPVRAGRNFHSGDLDADPGVVIVNQSFVDRILEGRNPVGRNVRYSAPEGQVPGPWFQIVGVVGDHGMVAGDGDPTDDPGFYRPTNPGGLLPGHIAIHVRGEPEAFAPRLQAVAADVDPTLRLTEILPMTNVGASLWREFEFLFRILVVASAIALLLSLTGIYSVMSFTVARRTREIGVRVAMGANASRVVAEILGRPLAQVGIGVLVGGTLAAALAFGVYGGGLTAQQGAMLVGYAAAMMAVCMLACIVPTRRALKVEPREALRAED